MQNYHPDSSGWAEYFRNRPEYQDKIKKFAERLHSEFCRLGHEDNCTWYFEKDWSGWAHKQWFEKSKELLSSGTAENCIVDIIEVFNGRKI